MKKNCYLAYTLLLILVSCEDIDSVPPSITITSPQQNSIVNEIIFITCISTDNVEVEKVELWINGDSVGAIDKTEPYQLEWNTTSFENNSYTVTVRSYDVNGNKADSEPLILIVDNNLSFPKAIILYPIYYLDNSFHLTWSQSQEEDFFQYKLYENDYNSIENMNLIHTSNTIDDTSFSVPNINIDNSKYYIVSVTDNFGYETNSTLNRGSSHQKVIFVRAMSNGSGSDIFIKELNGLDEEAVTTSGSRIKEFDISPDGEMLLISRSLGGTFSIYRLVDNCRLLYSHSGNNYYAKFSPNGQKIIFTGYTGTDNYNIFTMDIDGTNLIQLTDNLHCRYPVISNDGQKVIYTVYEGQNNSQIYSMNIDGTDKVKLTNLNECQYPQFSPDGEKIIFTNHLGRGSGELYIMDINGENLTKLKDDDRVTYPRFLPDGQKVIFNYHENYGDLIIPKIMNMDGTDELSLSTEGRSIHPLNYSQDGLKIIYTDVDLKKIFIKGIDGSSGNSYLFFDEQYIPLYPMFLPR